MATQSVIFTSSSIKPTNSERQNGSSVTVTFYRSSGSIAPNGAKLKSATLSFSAINVYSTRSPYFVTPYGNTGSFSTSNGGSQSVDIKSPSSSLLSFTGGDFAMTVASGSSDTANIFNVRTGSTVTLTVTYDVTNPSSGQLDKTSVAKGGSITLTVTPSDSSFTHRVTWTRDSSHSTYYDIGSGTSSTFTIPSSWSTGSATATLTTYTSGGATVGSVAYSFTVTADTSKIVASAGTLNVTLLQSSYVPSNWGVYVKGYSRARVSLSNASAGSADGVNGSFSTVELTCGSQKQSTQNSLSFDTEALSETGALQCTGKVTNNYGSSDSAAGKSITVYDYSEPAFVSALAFRCNASGVPSDNGAYIAVQANVRIASVNNNNALVSLAAQYKIGTGNWSTGTSLTNNVQTLLGGGISGTSALQVRFTAVDNIQNLRGTVSAQIVDVLTTKSCIHCLDGGLNVSIGKEGSRISAFEVDGDWQMWHGNNRFDDLLPNVPVDRGGTGATTAAKARENLGAAAATHTHAGSDLSSAVPVDKGGTGATTAAKARENLGVNLTNLGAAASNHSHAFSAITGSVARSQLPFKFAYGSTSVSGSTAATLDYSSAGFTSTPYVFVCYSTSGGNWTGDNGALKVHSKTARQATVIVGGSFSTARAIDWFAIGT